MCITANIKNDKVCVRRMKYTRISILTAKWNKIILDLYKEVITGFSWQRILPIPWLAQQMFLLKDLLNIQENNAPWFDWIICSLDSTVTNEIQNYWKRIRSVREGTYHVAKEIKANRLTFRTFIHRPLSLSLSVSISLFLIYFHSRLFSTPSYFLQCCLALYLKRVTFK